MNKLEDKLCPYYTEKPTCSNQGAVISMYTDKNLTKLKSYYICKRK